MTGIAMAIAALLATANAPEPVAVEWQTVVLTHSTPMAAKRAALAEQKIESRPVPEARPLVAVIQADGTLKIGHRKPEPKKQADAESPK